MIKIKYINEQDTEEGYIPKFKVGDKAYQCRNSSYVFESIDKLKSAIDLVEIISIQRIYDGKVDYLIKIVSGPDSIGMEHSQTEEWLFKSHDKIIKYLTKKNIKFIRKLISSERKDIRESIDKINTIIKISEHRLSEYRDILEVMRNAK